MPKEKKNNVVEYGPGDITYLEKDKQTYKLHKPESPIVEIWAEQYEKFFIKSAKTPVEMKILGVAVIVSFINLAAIHSDTIALPVLTISIGCYISFFANNAQIKKNKFKYAILNYQNLKKYEEIHPNEQSIINNKTLKGISKRKMKKRVKSLQTS